MIVRRSYQRYLLFMNCISYDMLNYRPTWQMLRCLNSLYYWLPLQGDLSKKLDVISNIGYQSWSHMKDSHRGFSTETWSTDLNESLSIVICQSWRSNGAQLTNVYDALPENWARRAVYRLLLFISIAFIYGEFYRAKKEAIWAEL